MKGLSNNVNHVSQSLDINTTTNGEIQNSIVVEIFDQFGLLLSFTVFLPL